MENKTTMDNKEEITLLTKELESIIFRIGYTTRIVLAFLILSLVLFSAFPIFLRIQYESRLDRENLNLAIFAFHMIFMASNFMGILTLHRFQQLKRNGEAYYDELTNAMELNFRISKEEEYFENQHRVRLTIKKFVNNANLPFVEAKNSVLIYFLFFFLLLIIGTTVMFLF